VSHRSIGVLATAALILSFATVTATTAAADQQNPTTTGVSAAPAPAPAAPVAAAPVPLATFGTQSSAVGAGSPGATTQGIDWGNVVRTLNSMVECEMLIPLYEVLYFPSSIVCLPYTGGTAVMVIVRWW